jgi:hypothetical protein
MSAIPSADKQRLKFKFFTCLRLSENERDIDALRTAASE